MSPVCTALMLVLAAGLAVPALAQNRIPAPNDSTAIAQGVDFRSASWLRDRSVVNNNAEEIANVSELILDRGSGRIEYIVVKTGTTLGMGGRAVAIPFASFGWESAGKDRFLLASTSEQLKQFPEYTAESWKALRDASKDDKSTLRQRLATDAALPNDPYAGNLDTAKKIRIEGEITNVERVRTSTFGEHVVITVNTADGTPRNITLGPSWYVNGSLAAPMRGEKVVVETLVLPRDPDRLLAATHYTSGDRELHLRDSDGTPAWALKAVEANGRQYSTSHSRYLLLSELPGVKIDSRGEECGKVHDIILDRNSGEIAFLSIDPNENFLGLKDTKRLVPWSVATVTLDGNVRIDASKEMILASPETPKEVDALNHGTTAEQAYKAYRVPAPRFRAPAPVSVVVPAKDSAWSAKGPIITAIEKDSVRTFECKVLEVTQASFGGGVQPAQAIKVRTGGDADSDETILLGPAWYLDNQKPVCKAGDTVKLAACRTTIDGKRYWMARSIDCKDARVVLISTDNAPAWASKP